MVDFMDFSKIYTLSKISTYWRFSFFQTIPSILNRSDRPLSEIVHFHPFWTNHFNPLAPKTVYFGLEAKK